MKMLDRFAYDFFMSHHAKDKPRESASIAPPPELAEPLTVLGRDLKGHENFVRSVAVSPDETWAASGSDDKAVRIWDLETGACRATLQGHTIYRFVPPGTNRVSSVAITPDGKRILSSVHKSVRVWDASSGRELAWLSGHKDKIWSVISLQDNARALSGGYDKTLKLWDLASGTCLKTIECGTYDADAVRSAAVNPAGTRALSGYRDGRVGLWDLETGQCLATLNGHSGSVRSVQIMPDGRVACSGSEDMTIKVWDLEGGTCIGTLEGHQNKVISVAISPDGALIASTGFQDNTVRLWDWKSGTCLQVIEYEKGLSPTSVAFGPLGLRLVVGVAGPGLLWTAFQALAPRLRPGAPSSPARPPGLAYVLRLTGARAAQPAEVTRRYVNATEHIPGSTLPWTTTPRLLAELKNAVMTMRDKADLRLLRFPELVQQLEQTLPGERFGESAVRTAVTLLANHGLVRFLKFGDLVLLRPDLMNGYAGAVMRAARAHRYGIGSVLEARLYEPGFNFTGVDRLSRPDEELLLRAMVQTFFDHSLCIAKDTPQGRHLVFPSQYRREKDIPWEPDAFISYTFSGEWQTVWNTLVVRLWYSQEFEHKELWRNAAEFQSSQGHLLGLKIDSRQGEDQATISLFFDVKTPDMLKAIYNEYVHRYLVRHTRDVTWDRRYVCPNCGQPVIDLDAVRRHLATGEAFITCQNCDAQVPLIDFFEQRLRNGRVAHRILTMEKKATRELATQAQIVFQGRRRDMQAV